VPWENFGTNCGSRTVDSEDDGCATEGEQIEEGLQQTQSAALEDAHYEDWLCSCACGKAAQVNNGGGRLMVGEGEGWMRTLD
jgi:hypothetical protein